MKLKFEKKYSPWKHYVKLCFQGVVIGACVMGFYFLFCL